MELELHPEAIEEAREARDWYELRSDNAAVAFVAELDCAVERISVSPERWARYLHGTRRYLMKRYPFAVVYRTLGDRLQIVAVAHGRRRPGYWRRRIK